MIYEALQAPLYIPCHALTFNHALQLTQSNNCRKPQAAEVKRGMPCVVLSIVGL